MINVKAADLRKNQKEYLDKAYDGETVLVERPQGRNVVMISEKEYNELHSKIRAFAYASKLAEFFKKNGFPEEN